MDTSFALTPKVPDQAATKGTAAHPDRTSESLKKGKEQAHTIASSQTNVRSTIGATVLSRPDTSARTQHTISDTGAIDNSKTLPVPDAARASSRSTLEVHLSSVLPDPAAMGIDDKGETDPIDRTSKGRKRKETGGAHLATDRAGGRKPKKRTRDTEEHESDHIVTRSTQPASSTIRKETNKRVRIDPSGSGLEDGHISSTTVPEAPEVSNQKRKKGKEVMRDEPSPEKRAPRWRDTGDTIPSPPASRKPAKPSRVPDTPWSSKPSQSQRTPQVNRSDPVSASEAPPPPQDDTVEDDHGDAVSVFLDEGTRRTLT